MNEVLQKLTVVLQGCYIGILLQGCYIGVLLKGRNRAIMFKQVLKQALVSSIFLQQELRIN